VIDTLARGLDARDHEVVVFASGDSTTRVPVRYVHPKALGFGVGSVGAELHHVLAARDFAESWGADLVHDHTITGAVVTPKVPTVVTNHGVFDETGNAVYGHASTHASVVAISGVHAVSAGARVKVSAVIHHGVEPEQYPEGPGGGGYAAFLGRMIPDKGLDVAIRVAREVGLPLRIGAKMREPLERQYFADVIRPMLGGSIEYLGELDAESKCDLLANADVLLNPIQWNEPFGMVMLESLACGTPVIATSRGAAPEIVEHGITGFIADDIEGLCRAVSPSLRLDRSRCRSVALAGFSAERMVDAHEALYSAVVV
jgi:glycosyltransferase involved in cell wall biosynthesis